MSVVESSSGIFANHIPGYFDVPIGFLKENILDIVQRAYMQRWIFPTLYI